MRNLLIDDSDILFFGDKRGRQFFIINTDNLSNFNFSDKNKSYNDITEKLISNNDSEYITFRKCFLENICYYFYNSKSNNILYIKSINSLLNTLNKNSCVNLNLFIKTAHETAVNENIKPKLSYCPESDSFRPSSNVNFNNINNILSLRIKRAWSDFKNNNTTKLINQENKKLDNLKTNSIIKLNDKYLKLDENGNLNEIELDFNNCNILGLNGNNNECNNVILDCLYNEKSIVNVEKCKKAILDNLNKSPNLLDVEDLHPGIVLALLYQFDFKAVIESDIHVIKFNTPHDLSSSDNKLKEYFEILINFINSNPEILNPSENIINSVSQISVDDLLNFFNNNINLYSSLNINVNFVNEMINFYKQDGGCSKLLKFKENLDNGQSGYKYLKNLWSNLHSNLDNITIEEESLKKINSCFEKLHESQNILVNFFLFVAKVIETNILNNELDKNDLDKLNIKLNKLFNDYKTREGKISQIIQDVAKYENNHENNSKIFDISNN